MSLNYFIVLHACFVSLFLSFRSRTVTSGCRACWTAHWTTRATRPFTTGSLSRKPRRPCRPRTACRASPWGTAMKRRVNIPPVWMGINSIRRGRIPALLIGARASCSPASATLPSCLSRCHHACVKHSLATYRQLKCLCRSVFDVQWCSGSSHGKLE